MKNKELEIIFSENVVIPKFLYKNKNLALSASFLYGDILRLYVLNGYCDKTNACWAKEHSCSTRSISRAISNLNKEGFIECSISSDYRRVLKIVESKYSGGLDKFLKIVIDSQ